MTFMKLQHDVEVWLEEKAEKISRLSPVSEDSEKAKSQLAIAKVGNMSVCSPLVVDSKLFAVGRYHEKRCIFLGVFLILATSLIYFMHRLVYLYGTSLVIAYTEWVVDERFQRTINWWS